MTNSHIPRPGSYRGRLKAKQENRCCYCDLPLTWRGHQNPRRATIEHLRRRADGGGNELDNLALACRECNERRGTMNWLLYKSMKRGELREFS